MRKLGLAPEVWYLNSKSSWEGENREKSIIADAIGENFQEMKDMNFFQIDNIPSIVSKMAIINFQDAENK